MKFLASLGFLGILSSTCYSQAYICNLDYHDDIRTNQESISATAIFFIDDCVSGNKISYQDTLGDFNVQISCQNQVTVHVTQKQRTISNIIEQQDFRKRFLKSYVSGRAGLRISCQERTIGLTLIDK